MAASLWTNMFLAISVSRCALDPDSTQLAHLGQVAPLLSSRMTSTPSYPASKRYVPGFYFP